MPSSDTSLKASLMRAGMPAGNATEVSNLCLVSGSSAYSLTLTGNLVLSRSDASATPGNATISLPSGRVSFAAGSAVIVVTNTLVTANTRVFATLLATDGTLTRISTVLPTAGSFTITADAAATTGGLAKVDWFIVN